MAIVYQHINNYTGEPFYIGIGKSISRAYDIKRRSTFWKGIVNKYGYSIEIIIDNISIEQAVLWEKVLIKLYGRRDIKTGILCNQTSGGEGVCDWIVSEEKKNKIRLQTSGSGNPMYGKTHTQEVKNKLSKRFSGAGHAMAKQVLDKETNKLYGSARECSRELGININTLVYKLKKHERFIYTNSIIVNV
jgi:hypothetical protein